MTRFAIAYSPYPPFSRYAKGKVSYFGEKKRKQVKNMKTRSFTVLIYKENDLYVAECPEVGTVDQGETIEQASANLKEATRLYLEEFPLAETSPRYVTSIEVSYA